MRKRTNDAKELFEEKEYVEVHNNGILNQTSNPWEQWSYKKEPQIQNRRNNNDSIIINDDKSVSIRTKYDSSFRNSNRKMTPSIYMKGNTYTSFSGADSIVSVKFPNAAPVIVGEISSFTYSIFRPKEPVYRLGSAYPVGFVKGPRTIAGSIIFTIFDRHPIINALRKAYGNSLAECLDTDILPDQLPPFDFQVAFLNEYGQSAILEIYGVQLVAEGQVMSIEDMLTENTMQYVAKSIKVMTPDVYENT